jgi:hypothetical protein
MSKADLSLGFWLALTGVVFSSLSIIAISNGREIKTESRFWSIWPFGKTWKKYVPEDQHKLFSKIRWRVWVLYGSIMAVFIFHEVEILNQQKEIRELVKTVDQENKINYNDTVDQYNKLPETAKKGAINK